MCCEGCKAVAELIAGTGLSDYYRFRTQPAARPETVEQDQWQRFALPEIASQYVQEDAAGQQVTTLLVEGLRCAACSWLIERSLMRVAGVVSARVNLASGRLRVVWRADQLQLPALLRSLHALGYPAQPVGADTVLLHKQQERRAALRRLGVAGLGMMQVMMYVLPLYLREQTRMDADVARYLQLISLLLTTPVLFYSGLPFLQSAWRALRHRSINMDVPVSLALLMAYFASVYNTLRNVGETWFDSVTMFVFLLSLGRYIEMILRHRSASRSDALAQLQPVSAQRYARDATGHEALQEVLLRQLQPGDEIAVRAGAVIAADGVVVSGASSVDESLLTGESLPQSRRVNDPVRAGTVNVEAPLRVRVTAVGSATVLSGVLALLDKAQSDKPPLAQAADRVARYFLHILLMLSAVVGLVWWRIDPTRAFEAVLAVLVISCPCALSLATPAVIAAASAALARKGLLVTQAEAIERLAQVQRVVFDKTGTLTTGRMTLARIDVSGPLDERQCMQLAAALESGAEHPIAQAFRQRAQALALPLLPAHSLAVLPGAGVEGTISGVVYRLGRPDYVAGLTGGIFQSQAEVSDHAIVLAGAGQLLARFELQDPLRSDAALGVEQLKALGIGSALLSGDALPVVQEVARTCGINDYRARCTPADKLQQLKRLQQHEQVAMVGDGINDAPVLSAAEVAIAMGAGSGLAQASADAVLLNNSLTTLPQAITVARRALRVMHQNLWWAACYNIVGIPLAALGWVPPWAAALGMSFSSVLVVANAARLLRASAPSTPTVVAACPLPVVMNVSTP